MQTDTTVHAPGHAAPGTPAVSGFLTRGGEVATVKASLTGGNNQGVSQDSRSASGRAKHPAETVKKSQKVALGSDADVHAAPAPLAPAAAPLARGATLDRWGEEGRRHLELMGYGPGAVELVAGTNDPGNPEKIILLTYAPAQGRAFTTRRWVASDRPLALIEKAAELAEQWGNVYVGVGTFGKAPNPHRPGTLHYSRSAPEPRRCIVADDVTELSALPLPPTWATETSPGNYQVGYVAEQLLSPAQAELMGQSLAALMGADGSGWDATQLIRLAGSLNTKPKCAGRPGNPAENLEPEGWRVRLRAEGPRYSIEDLARALLPGGLAELQKGGAARRAARPAVEQAPPAEQARLEALGAALMASPRYQRYFTHRPQLAALAQRQRITLPTRYGLRDSGSEQVAVLVSNLASSAARDERGVFVPGLDAPPIEEIRAVALFWHKTLRPEKSAAEYLADVDRLLRPAPDGYLPEGYRPKATAHIPGMRAGAPAGLEPPRHRGRPAGARAAQVDALGGLLAARVGEDVTRGQLADLLGVKTRALAGYLAELRAADGWDVTIRNRGRGGLHIEKCARKSAAESVHVPEPAPHGCAENAPVELQGVHTAPLCDPAGCVPPLPAAPATDEQPGETARQPEPAEAWRERMRRYAPEYSSIYDPWRERLKWERHLAARESAPVESAPLAQQALGLIPPELADLAAVLELRADTPEPPPRALQLALGEAPAAPPPPSPAPEPSLAAGRAYGLLPADYDRAGLVQRLAALRSQEARHAVAAD